MPTNKNQHYVPRCYLKQFSFNCEGKTINVFNIDRNRAITSVPVKSQCSRDYFYGQDDHLENAIQSVEREYSKTLNKIIQNTNSLTDSDKYVLKMFWLLQYLRTEAASKRSVEMAASMGNVARIDSKEFEFSIKEAVLAALRSYIECYEYIDDLKVCLVKNKTTIPFISSDDPAIITNRWHLTDKRTMNSSFGLSSAGNTFLMPLTPKLMFVAYDGDVYRIGHKKGIATTSNKKDIIGFNQHQFLNCFANLYFKSSEDACFIKEFFKEISNHRLTAKHQINYAILDSTDGKSSIYKVVDPKTAQSHTNALIHADSLHYKPSFWPSVLRWRSNGSVYSTGTGAGYVRKQYKKRSKGRINKEPVFMKKRKS